MANAERLEYANVLVGALTLSSQSAGVCPISAGEQGLWNDAGTIKWRDPDGNDSTVATQSGLPVFAAYCKTAATLTVSTGVAPTYNNGTDGVGAYLIGSANGAIGTIGGVALTSADVGRMILVDSEANQAHNGLYELTQAGAAGSKYKLVRVPGFDGEIVDGAMVGIQSGTSAGVLYVQTETVATVGTDNVAFAVASTGVTWAAMVSAAATANSTFGLKKETNQTINVITSTTATTAGGNLSIAAGAGATTGTGGTLALAGGAGGNDGVGGQATLTAGAAGGATRAGGAVAVTGGAGLTTGAGGQASIVGGAGGNDAVGGAVLATGGAAGGGDRAGGAVTATGGAGAGTQAGGAVSAVGGAGGATGAGGAANLTGGAGGATSGTGGAIAIAGGAGTNGNANGGAVAINGGAKNGAGADGAINIGTTRGAVTIGAASTTLTINSKQASSATTNDITDPGNAGAVPVTTSGVCNMTTAGAETRTVADPTFSGQWLVLSADVHVGNNVVTFASDFDSTTNNVWTSTAAGQSAEFRARRIAGALKWMLVANNGGTLS